MNGDCPRCGGFVTRDQGTLLCANCGWRDWSTDDGRRRGGDYQAQDLMFTPSKKNLQRSQRGGRYHFGRLV